MTPELIALFKAIPLKTNQEIFELIFRNQVEKEEFLLDAKLDALYSQIFGSESRSCSSSEKLYKLIKFNKTHSKRRN